MGQWVWKRLWRQKLRTWLTVGSVGIATALVVLVGGIGRVGCAVVEEELEDMGLNGLAVSAPAGLTAEHLETLRSCDRVADAEPLSLRTGKLRRNGQEYTVLGCGVDAGTRPLIALDVLSGRALTQEDVSEGRRVCLLDETTADRVFGGSSPLDSSVSVQLGKTAEKLTVIGVVAAESSLIRNVTSVIPYMVYLPYTTAQALSGRETIDRIAIRVEPENGTDGERAEEAVLRVLDAENVELQNLSSHRQKLDGLLAGVSSLVTAVGGVSLAVAGVGIFTVMLSQVGESAGEIAVEKALGAGRMRVMGEYLLSAIVISGLGALLGLAVAGIALWSGCRWLGVSPYWSWTSAAGAFIGILLLGGVCGAYPAFRAAGYPPTEILRRE